MAKQRSLHSGSVGRVGNIVYRQYRGMNVSYERPTTVHNPRTQPQVLQRNKFALMSRIARAFAAPAAIGLRPQYQGTIWAWRNMFSKLNFPLISHDEEMQCSIDLTKVKVSDGQMPGASFRTPTYEGDLTVEAAYGADPDVPGCDAHDEVYLFVYQADLNEGILGAPALRSEGSVSVKVPAAWSGMKVHVYGFARKVFDYIDPVAGVVIYPAGTCSATTYLGSGNVE